MPNSASISEARMRVGPQVMSQLFEQVVRPLSDSEAHQLQGLGKQKNQQKEDPVDFTAIEIELQRKGVTLALLWREGLDKGQWHYSYATFCRHYNLADCIYQFHLL